MYTRNPSNQDSYQDILWFHDCQYYSGSTPYEHVQEEQQDTDEG